MKRLIAINDKEGRFVNFKGALTSQYEVIVECFYGPTSDVLASLLADRPFDQDARVDGVILDFHMPHSPDLNAEVHEAMGGGIWLWREFDASYRSANRDSGLTVSEVSGPVLLHSFVVDSRWLALPITKQFVLDYNVRVCPEVMLDAFCNVCADCFGLTRKI